MIIKDRILNSLCPAAISMIIAGCGQKEMPKTNEEKAPAHKVVATEAAESAGKTELKGSETRSTPTAKAQADALAAKPAAPTSLAEATRLIDLRVLPMLDSEKTLTKTATNLAYQLGKADLTEGAKFYRAKLTEAGWKVGDDYFDKDKGYWSTTWSKNGYLLRFSIVKAPDSGKLTVFAENMGNVDGRTLPRPARAEVKQLDFSATIFQTDEKPANVAKFIRAELGKLGYRVLRVDDNSDETGTDKAQSVTAIQRGITINASIHIEKDKTEVLYWVRLLSAELPIMPEVSGPVDFRDDPILVLEYLAKAGIASTLDFYRKELTALGWTMRPGTDKIDQGKAKVLFDAPEQQPVVLVLTAINEGHTAVGMARAEKGK